MCVCGIYENRVSGTELVCFWCFGYCGGQWGSWVWNQVIWGFGVKVLDGGGLWEEECKRGKKGWGNGQ